MFEEEPLLFLTGGTGLVGSEWLKLLLATNPRQHVAVLARQPERLKDLTGSGVRVLRGDVTHPHLGVDSHVYAELNSSITEIIHCAADTRFGVSLEHARAVNTEGTREMLNLASACRRLQKFAYISTVYVVGRSTGYFHEKSIRHQNAFCNAYQQSKYEAEELVAQSMGDIPAVVFRLSSMIGDSHSGLVRQFNHVHRLIRLLPQNLLPMAPGDPQAPIDLVPTDWAMAALAYLFESAFVPSRFYHICAGRERSMTVREMIDLTVSVFEHHPKGRESLPILVPELVSLSRYEEFVKERRRDGDKLLNELVRVLGHFLPHLAMFQAFDNKNTLLALAESGLELPPIRECYEKVVQFCLETNWGRSPQQPIWGMNSGVAL